MDTITVLLVILVDSMKLKDWLAEKGLSYADFGARIGRTAQAVQRYAAGQRIPERNTMVAIIEATDGAVQSGDFYDIDHVQIDKRGSRASSPGKAAPISGGAA